MSRGWGLWSLAWCWGSTWGLVQLGGGGVSQRGSIWPSQLTAALRPKIALSETKRPLVSVEATPPRSSPMIIFSRGSICDDGNVTRLKWKSCTRSRGNVTSQIIQRRFQVELLLQRRQFCRIQRLRDVQPISEQRRRQRGGRRRTVGATKQSR